MIWRGGPGLLWCVFLVLHKFDKWFSGCLRGVVARLKTGWGLLIGVFYAGDELLQVVAQLLFTASHQECVFKRVLRGLVEFGHVLVHHFDFFGAGDGAAVVAEPFGHGGLRHGVSLWHWGSLKTINGRLGCLWFSGCLLLCGLCYADWVCPKRGNRLSGCLIADVVLRVVAFHAAGGGIAGVPVFAG